jgi:hypothetical protein
VHLFYPEAGVSRCTFAVLLEVDPIALVRGRKGAAGEGGQLQQYVNDRPYASLIGREMPSAWYLDHSQQPTCQQTDEPKPNGVLEVR